MEIIKKQPKKDVHPYIPELQESLRKGQISRREFLRYASLLGMSVSAASVIAACTPAATPEPTAVPPTAMPPTAVPPTAMPPTAVPPTAMPPTAAPTMGPTAVPATAAPTGPVRGGTLTVASRVQKVAHPANLSWVSATNQLRQVAEYLTQTDEKFVTHPLLLDSWKPSDDLKTWTLNLRKGIKFNNGDDFTADDVIFTMNEWFKKDVGSSIAGLMSYMKPTGIEKVDANTVVLHLDQAQIGVPEHLFHYPAMILNSKTFQGDFIKAPHGTGPYTLTSYKEGGSVVLTARKDYWQNAPDGKPYPYLDSMQFIDEGNDTAAWIAALKGGQVDYLDTGDNTGPDFYNGLKDDPNINVTGTPTPTARIMRMRVDLDPWKDVNVRKALKLCQDRQKILNLAYFGQGALAGDFHVYSGFPDYMDIGTPKYDPAQAKQLLTAAGHPDGLKINLAVGTGWPDIVAYAQILKEDAAAGGFDITINSMPNDQYWNKWTEVDLGVTPWLGRPLSTMILNLAYTSDSKGKPVAWNESRWVDDEFNKILTQANGTLDVNARKALMGQLEKIQQDRGSIGVAWWMNVWTPYRKVLQGVVPQPSLYMLFNGVWKSA
jgi:peptide/nickel transport system substrate-binding protein